MVNVAAHLFTKEAPLTASSLVAGPTLLALADGSEPQLADRTFLAPGATVVGSVRSGERASNWYSATLRADCGGHEIYLGERSNVQDNVSIHVGLEHLVRVGAGVSIGHNAVLHGCEIADDVLIGMGAIVLNGARGSVAAAWLRQAPWCWRALKSRSGPSWPGCRARCAGRLRTTRWPRFGTTRTFTSSSFAHTHPRDRSDLVGPLLAARTPPPTR